LSIYECEFRTFRGNSSRGNRESGGDRAWTIRAGWIYMQRSAPASQVLINFPSGKPNLNATNIADFARNPDFSGGQILLNASQLHIGFQPAFEVALARQITADWEVEARYMQILDSTATSVLTIRTPPVNLDDLGANIGGYGTNPRTIFYADPGTAFRTTYRYGLGGVESTLWRRLNDRLRIGGGFRLINFNDTLVISSTFGGSQLNPFFPPVGGLHFDAKNNLYGFQVAGEGRLWPQRRLNIEAIGRAGIYINVARQYSLFENQIVSVKGAASGAGSAVAYGGDVDFMANFQLSKYFSLRAGYNLMVLRGLALASNQVPNTSSLNSSVSNSSTIGQTRLDTGGGIFAHGLKLELKLRW
jgi:hypothetical protein